MHQPLIRYPIRGIVIKQQDSGPGFTRNSRASNEAESGDATSPEDELRLALLH
jgi:hypothetical protein